MSNKVTATDMKPETKRELKPKLRFPEFQDAPEWERKQLSELLFETKQRNRKLEYGAQDVLSVSGEYGCVNQIEFMGRSYAGASVKDYHVVETRDIVYTKSPLKKNPFGIIKENKGKPGIVSTLYAVYRVTDMGHSTYLDHYFSRDYNLNSYLQPIVKKGAKNDMKVNNSAVLGGEILVPKIDEQQKIAECLSSIDEVIAGQSQKLDALKAHKKGLLQQLFPAEGQTLPQLRFPEFQDAPEWEEKPLGKIATFTKGKGISKADISPHGSQPCIRYGELYTHYNETINSVVSYTDLLPDDLVLSRANDVIIPASGETQIDIATASCVLKSGIALGGDLNIIRSKMNGVFLSYYLNNAKKKAIADMAQGISVVHLYSSQLETLKINTPRIAEQQKIADCLSSLDELIAAQTQKLDMLKVHKKGLLQQLFPSPDEVKG